MGHLGSPGLARCMREKDVPAEVAVELLAGLPATFDEWVREREQELEREPVP